jgi:hypothetical protein
MGLVLVLFTMASALVVIWTHEADGYIYLDAIGIYVSNHLRLFISIAAGFLVFVGVVGISVFLISVSGGYAAYSDLEFKREVKIS